MVTYYITVRFPDVRKYLDSLELLLTDNPRSWKILTSFPDNLPIIGVLVIVVSYTEQFLTLGCIHGPFLQYDWTTRTGTGSGQVARFLAMCSLVFLLALHSGLMVKPEVWFKPYMSEPTRICKSFFWVFPRIRMWVGLLSGGTF
jgi:hypothetical protein